MDSNEIAERLARAALQGFFGTERTDFRDMSGHPRKMAAARVREELNKLNLVPAPAETTVGK